MDPISEDTNDKPITQTPPSFLGSCALWINNYLRSQLNKDRDDDCHTVGY